MIAGPAVFYGRLVHPISPTHVRHFSSALFLRQNPTDLELTIILTQPKALGSVSIVRWLLRDRGYRRTGELNCGCAFKVLYKLILKEYGSRSAYYRPQHCVLVIVISILVTYGTVLVTSLGDLKKRGGGQRE